MYVIQSDKGYALKYLEISLNSKEVSAGLLLDDDWLELKNDNDFKALLTKCEKQNLKEKVLLK